jgi:EsV-1-7 cysteine-rich motif
VFRVDSLLWCVFTQVSITPDKPMGQKKKHPQAVCQHPACTGIVASFGFESDKRRVRCVTHKEEGMIYVASRRCKNPSCNKQATFGLPDTKVSDTAHDSLSTDVTCCDAELPPDFSVLLQYVLTKPLACALAQQ